MSYKFAVGVFRAVMRFIFLLVFLFSTSTSSIGVVEVCRISEALQFGFDSMFPCRFQSLNSDCTAIRLKIDEFLHNITEEIKSSNVTTINGKEVTLYRRNSLPSTNSTATNGTGCLLTALIEYKILYVPSQEQNQYRVIGYLVTKEQWEVPEIIPDLWTVRVLFIFREAKPKSRITRWWSEISSRDGSSYSILRLFDPLLELSYPAKSQLFSLFSAIPLLLFLLRSYY